MNKPEDSLKVQDTDTRQFEKEIREMVPELMRPFKLEGAALANTLVKPTFEEFLILAETEARFRPGYSETPELVSIPNVFARIRAEKGQKDALLAKLAVSPNDAVIRCAFNSPLYQKHYGDAVDFGQFIQENRLDRQGLKRCPAYGLQSLKPAYQELFLSKIEFMLENSARLFTEAFALAPSDLLATLVRLRPNLLEVYNRFDFQGHLPRLLVEDTSKPFDSTEAQKTSAILVFLALLDFDVVVLNDTHGASFETYVQDSLYCVFHPEGFVAEAPKPQNPMLPVAMVIGCLLFLFIAYQLFFKR